MTFAFAAAMGLLILGSKLVSAFRLRPPPGFWPTLLPAQSSMTRVRLAARADTSRALARFAFAVLGFITVWLACHSVARMAGLNGAWLGWLAAPLVWLMGEVVGALHQALLLPSGRLLPLPHRNIFAARSVSDFWGRRWNVWVSDWFREIIFRPLRARPLLAMAVVFLVSGILHEAVVSLSFWLVTGRSLFGLMMAYFGVQAAGVFMERAWLGGSPRLKRVFTWMVVFGPAPLFVNEGILRAFWLWP